MISLKRDRRCRVIPPEFCGAKRVDREFDLLKAKQDDRMKGHLTSTLWKTAKPALADETNGGKCAYCECPTSVVAHGDVDHFRPKSVWWWLSCCYDNMIFSCQICNQVYKKDSFPLAGGCGPLGEPNLSCMCAGVALESLAGSLAPDPIGRCKGRVTYLANCRKEKALLIHPYEDHPEKLIVYEADDVLREVRVSPRKPAYQARIKACEEYLGINRERLCRERWRRYEFIECAWKALSSKPLPPDTEKKLMVFLSQATRGDQAFAGMARYFIREVWKVPELARAPRLRPGSD